MSINQISHFKDGSFMDDLFPFHVLINRDMTVDGAGKSMAKLGFVNVGDHFFNNFTVERPLQTKSFDDIKKQGASLFIIQVNKEIGFKFRGQMYYDASNDQLCFLGSPLVNSFDDLKAAKLTLTDFALHDNISQFLFTFQMQISSLNDSKNIADRLENSNHKLKQSNEELQQFAYILSHDLKSPLRGISTLADFIQDDLNEENLEELPSHIQGIKKRVMRMGNLIEGIMDFTKIGMVKSNKEDIDLNSLLKVIFDENITDENIKFQIKTTLPVINHIQVLFIQLFSNLINNSVKYNDKKQGLIIVDYKKSNDFHEFSIEDNGPGIAQEYHEKIFQVFQTLNSRDTIESTGVGLSIVKKIVSLLNGSIRLESKINEGTIFYIKIPKN